MSQEIRSTELKQHSSRKHFPILSDTKAKEENFLYQLLQRRYSLNRTVQQFTYGKLFLESSNTRVPFRMFKDSEMNIASHFQKKLHRTTVDDDVMTTSSQVKHAYHQNKKDIVQRIYEKERLYHKKNPSLDEMEQSLFEEQEKRNFLTQVNSKEGKTTSNLFLSQ